MRVEPREPGGLLPAYCVESPSITNMCPSPAATVFKDGEGMVDAGPDFKLSQCFGDCSPVEETTPGEHGAIMGVSPYECKVESVHCVSSSVKHVALKVTLGGV